MKVKKIASKLYKACIEGDVVQEKMLWIKAIKKSLKGKKTHSIK